MYEPDAKPRAVPNVVPNSVVVAEEDWGLAAAVVAAAVVAAAVLVVVGVDQLLPVIFAAAEYHILHKVCLWFGKNE